MLPEWRKQRNGPGRTLNGSRYSGADSRQALAVLPITASTPGAVPAGVLLSGHDLGTTNRETNKYHMTGYVMVANGPFEGLEGRGVRMSGVINWSASGPPETAPGRFRIH